MIKYGNRLNARPVGQNRYQLPDGNVVNAQCLANMERNIDQAEIMRDHGISAADIQLLQDTHDAPNSMQETLQSIEDLRNKYAKKFRRRTKHMLAVGYSHASAQAYLDNNIADMDATINQRMAPHGYELR